RLDQHLAGLCEPFSLENSARATDSVRPTGVLSSASEFLVGFEMGWRCPAFKQHQKMGSSVIGGPLPLGPSAGPAGNKERDPHGGSPCPVPRPMLLRKRAAVPQHADYAVL